MQFKYDLMHNCDACKSNENVIVVGTTTMASFVADCLMAVGWSIGASFYFMPWQAVINF